MAELTAQRIEAERVKFEAWAGLGRLMLDRVFSDERYVSMEVERAYAAWLARASEVADQGEIAEWQYRTYRDGCGGEPVGWGEWERVVPRSRLSSADDAVAEIQGYIANGSRYELRPLYTRPAAPGWNPIETAPQVTGIEVIATGHNHGDQREPRHVVAALWHDDIWVSSDTLEPLTFLTHWMPLPAAPSPKGDQE
ncbi:MAG: hypothetical protein V4669_13985 [Pseudomonadota bacterium]